MNEYAQQSAMSAALCAVRDRAEITNCELLTLALTTMERFLPDVHDGRTVEARELAHLVASMRALQRDVARSAVWKVAA